MSDLVKISRRLYASATLDSDGGLEMEMDGANDVVCTRVGRCEIPALLMHLELREREMQAPRRRASGVQPPVAEHSVLLDHDEVLVLIAHLSKVLADADKKQETER